MKRSCQRGLLAVAVTGALAVLAACGGGGDSQRAGLASTSAPLVTKAETPADASRFLAQSTFGPTTAEIDRVMAVQLEDWLAQEFAKPQTYTHLGYWQERVAADGNPNASDTNWIYWSFWRS